MESILIVDKYIPQCPIRQREIDACLAHNFNLGFSGALVYGDNSGIPGHLTLLDPSPRRRRLKFSDFLYFVNANSSKNGFAILTNTDIALDPQIISKCSQIQPEVVFALSRYEASGQLATSPWCTQDTWVLEFQPIHNSAIAATNFYLGTPGCELRFTEALYATGFTIFNPCLSIKNLHVQQSSSTHNDEDRHYGSYIFTPPCSLEHVTNRDENFFGTPVYLRKDSPLRLIP